METGTPHPTRRRGLAAPPETRTGFRIGYVPGLDGIRGICVLSLMSFHFTTPLRATGGRPLPVGGPVMMVLFFVLSGYLISGFLLQEWDRRDAISVRNFYARRALRILPAMIVMLGVFSVYVVLARPPHLGVADALRSDVYILGGFSNWVRAVHPQSLAAFPQMWSLSVEAQFYLVWPLVLLGLLRLRLSRGAIIALLAGGIVACSLYRAALFSGPASSFRAYYDTVSWGDAWLVGCLVAFLAWWRWLPTSGPALVALRALAAAGAVLIGYLCATSLVFHDAGLYRGLFTAVAVSTGLLIATLLTRPPRVFSAVLGFRPLVWVGVISYGLYAWHIAAAFWLPARTGIPVWPLVGLRTAATLAIAVVSYRLVEQPFLRMKLRFGSTSERSGRPPPASAAAPASPSEPRSPGGVEG